MVALHAFGVESLRLLELSVDITAVEVISDELQIDLIGLTPRGLGPVRCEVSASTRERALE